MKETLARTNHQTLTDVYDQVELDEMRRAMEGRGVESNRLRADSIS
jgi:hypothetical protein